MMYHSTPRSDTVAAAFALAGPDRRIVAVNDALARQLGYTPAELCGRTLDAITFAPDIDLDADDAEQLFRGAIPTYEVTKRYKHKDGGLVKMQLQVSTVTDANQKILFAVVHARSTAVAASVLPGFPQGDETTDEVEKIKRAMFW